MLLTIDTSLLAQSHIIAASAHNHHSSAAQTVWLVHLAMHLHAQTPSSQYHSPATPHIHSFQLFVQDAPPLAISVLDTNKPLYRMISKAVKYKSTLEKTQQLAHCLLPLFYPATADGMMSPTFPEGMSSSLSAPWPTAAHVIAGGVWDAAEVSGLELGNNASQAPSSTTLPRIADKAKLPPWWVGGQAILGWYQLLTFVTCSHVQVQETGCIIKYRADFIKLLWNLTILLAE